MFSFRTISKTLRRTSAFPRNAKRCKSATPAAKPPPALVVSEATANSQNVPVAKSLAAAVLGASTVSLAAAIAENLTAHSVPDFDPKGQRYDPESFQGRFSRMLLACDPRLLLYTEDQVKRSQEMVENWEKYADGTKEMDRTLWEAKRITDGALHPDTGDVIPRPFRMSGYVMYNGPVCVAMVASQSTLPLLFWAWVNQSQNALVNYYNRNASSPMTNETLLKSYAGAVGSALIVAFGLSTFIQKRFDAHTAKRLLRWVAFPSSVVASSLNCYIVRSPEMETGITLMDENGDDVLPGETSQEAATRGVHSTTISRAMLQAPVFFMPPLLVSAGPIQKFLSKKPSMAVPVTTYVLMLCFGVGLPCTVAFFPQIARIDVDDVEDKFKHLRNPKTNGPYEVYYYNKGL